MDGRRHLKIELVLMMTMVLFGVVACSSPGEQLPTVTSAQATAVLTEATAPTATQAVEQPPTQEQPAGEPVLLNTCDLLTPDDVQLALGETPTGMYDSHSAACVYTASSGQRLIVAAYQGQVARDRTNEGMQLALQYFGNPTAQQLYDDVQPQLSNMTMAEMAATFSTIEQAMGREVTPYPELGDASYLVWIDGRSLQLGVVRGETTTSVVTIDVDRAAAEPAIMLLTETLWSRLPAHFAPAP